MVESLADSANFNLIGEDLGNDVKSGLRSALAQGNVFYGGNDPLSIFRSVLRGSIREIENDKRGLLFQRFLRDGPYEDTGKIPFKLQARRLTDDETELAITFIYSFMINSFKGAITELLAAAACQLFLNQLRASGVLTATARLFVGDAVMVHRRAGNGILKGADLHILSCNDNSTITVDGVVEVKSGHKSANAMNRQLDQHIQRAKHGLRVVGVDYPADRVRVNGLRKHLLKITVQPSDWKLPRTFHFENTDHSRILQMDPPPVPIQNDQIAKLSNRRWHISLKWSKEAIAQAAYEMTFWYMGKVGEIIYTAKESMPETWREMTPSEAGRNAAKMMLYYAILRCRTARATQRAIVLYNSYSFGYALGTNFRNPKGRHEMLWPEDLDEILVSGKTKSNCYIKFG